jgi:hypothetical protein
MILLGYASALRGAELVALTLADIQHEPTGLLLTIRASKMDQEGHGAFVAVAHGRHAATDPVAALKCLAPPARRHARSAVHPPVGQHHQPPPRAGRAVARVLRGRAEAAGLDATRITAHSLRAGHATTAALAGVPSTGSPPRPDTRTFPCWSTATSGPSKPSPPHRAPASDCEASTIPIADRSHDSSSSRAHTREVLSARTECNAGTQIIDLPSTVRLSTQPVTHREDAVPRDVREYGRISAVRPGRQGWAAVTSMDAFCVPVASTLSCAGV